MPLTIDDVRDHIDAVIETFESDPPDSDFQDGFLAAYESIEEWMEAQR